MQRTHTVLPFNCVIVSRTSLIKINIDDKMIKTLTTVLHTMFSDFVYDKQLYIKCYFGENGFCQYIQ